jgi:hypothetical protein
LIFGSAAKPGKTPLSHLEVSGVFHSRLPGGAGNQRDTRQSVLDAQVGSAAKLALGIFDPK